MIVDAVNAIRELVESFASEVRCHGLIASPPWEQELIRTLEAIGCEPDDILRRMEYAHFGGKL